MMCRPVLSFLILVIFLSTFISCEIRETIFKPECKGDCAVVVGHIFTGDGNEPVKNVTLKVRWYDYVVGNFIKSKILAITKTDDSGSYLLKFKAENEGHYEVIIENNEDYFKLPDKDFHQFSLPQLNNDSILVIDYVMPYNTKLIIEFEEFENVENYYLLSILFPLGVNFEHASGYSLSWSSSKSEFMHKIDVAAEVPIFLVKTTVINDSTYIYDYDTISVPRHETQKYNLEFDQ
ncbi:hypothetical protein [Marivirga sp.]|uniref:hypothetical protein n=1 Tax=Marivirga sp. TaxID=2018662 RepID=UPI0025FE8DDF|nr:hypothetical protein [Marivirga sp.]